MQTRSRIWTVVMLGCALLGLVGCRAFDPTATQTANRIPPPATGSYAIPNGTARNTAEPYYARPTDGSPENAAAGGASGGTTSRSGSWYSAEPSASPSSAGTSAAATAIRDTQVQPASFRSAAAPGVGARAIDLSQLLPVETTAPPGVELGDGSGAAEDLAAGVPMTADMQRATDQFPVEPQRLPESQATALPSEAGAIGSGVKPTVPSTPLPSTVPGRVSAGSTTLPQPLTPADLNTPGSTSWRPRLGG